MKKFEIFLIVGLVLMIPLVQAGWEWDNVKNFKEEGKYGKIEIRNSILGLPFLQLGQVAEYELLENTNECLVDCYAEGTAILYEKGKLFSEMRFENKVKKERDISYKISVKSNGKWIKYDGEQLDEGEYGWRVEGKKKPFEDVDWIGTAFGIELDDWAWWNSNWEKRREVTIQGAEATLDNFTVLLNVSYDSDMQADFDGLRFVDGACSGTQDTELDYERDVVSNSNYALVWVKIPQLSTGPDTICMYYDNDGAANGEDIPNAWDTHYRLIYHFTEGSGTNVFDSSMSEGNGTLHIGGEALWNTTEARIGNAYTFNSSAGINITKASGINFTDAPITIETFLLTSVINAYKPVVGGDANNGWVFVTNNPAILQLGKQAVDSVSSTDGIAGDVSAYVSAVYDISNEVNFTINRTADSGNPIGYSTTFTAASTMNIGRDGSGASFAGVLDEIRISNISRGLEWQFRSRDNVLMNNSFGSEEEVLTTRLNSPVNDFNTTLTQVFFNCTSEDDTQIENITLFLNGINEFEYIHGTSAFAELYHSEGLSIGQYNWTCVGRDNDNNAIWAVSNFTLNIFGMTENLATFNLSTFDTSYESFILNITYNSSHWTTTTANLMYNGSSYIGASEGTVNERIFSRSIDVDRAGGINKSFYWDISLKNSSSTIHVNSSVYNQTVDSVYLNLCNGSLGPTFLNFTFQNEETLTAMNAQANLMDWTYWLGSGTVNNTFQYTETSDNPSYGFCFSVNRTMHNDLTFQYSNTSFPQRRYFFDGDLTNVTTDKILYLLGTASGIYSVYQVQTEVGGAISGVIVVVERQFSGVWTVIEQGTTDGAGAVTFWLNPNYDHRLTFTKAGYTSLQKTIRPSSSTYTVIMGDAGVGAIYNSSTEGMLWLLTPGLILLTPNTEYNFSFSVTANKSNLAGCRMELLNNDSGVMTTITGCTTNVNSGSISTLLNTGENNTIRGRYSLDIGGGYFIVDADARWIVMNITIAERGTINSFFKYISRLNEFGENSNRQEFTRIVLFFVITMIILGVMSLSTGWDFSTVGGALLFFVPLVLIASYGGFFQMSYSGEFSAWMDKWTIGLIAGCIGVGYIFNKIAETIR